MKILYVSYHFPPSNTSSTSVMNYQIVKELSKDNELDVVAMKHDKFQGNSQLLDNLNENTKVNFTKPGFLHRKFYKDSSLDSKKGDISPIKKLLKKFSKLKEVILIPDPVIDWFFIAYKESRKVIINSNIDLIISSATPYTSHIVSFFVSKISKKPLILFYGDPWVYEQSRKRGRVRFIFEKFIEQRIIDSSTHIFFVTNTTRELYIKKYKVKKEKTSCVTLGYDNKDFSNHHVFEDRSKIKLLYGGSLNPVHRNPEPFFNAISSINSKFKNKITFDLYTDEYDKYKKLVGDKKIDDVVMIKKIIPYKEFLKETATADLLILFGNSSNLQIPGKVFDYIGSRTRILLISNNEDYLNDPTHKMLSNFKNNFSVINSEEKIKEILEYYINTYKYNDNSKNDESEVIKYQWENTLKPLVKYVRSFKE